MNVYLEFQISFVYTFAPLTPSPNSVPQLSIKIKIVTNISKRKIHVNQL